MKVLHENYVFTPSTKRITFSGLQSIDLENILLITNTTTGTIIYNFAKPELGAVKFNANTITLDYNTASMSSSDRLQIFIEVNPATTTFPALSNTFSLLANKIYHISGVSYYGQEQFLQIYKSNIVNENALAYTRLLKPFEQFDIAFEQGIDSPLGAIIITNSSTPRVWNPNNNNLTITVSRTN